MYLLNGPIEVLELREALASTSMYGPELIFLLDTGCPAAYNSLIRAKSNIQRQP